MVFDVLIIRACVRGKRVRVKIFHHLTLAAASLCLAITSAYALDGNAKAGEQATAMCVACHQADGSGMNVPGGESWPSLAGLNAEFYCTDC